MTTAIIEKESYLTQNSTVCDSSISILRQVLSQWSQPLIYDFKKNCSLKKPFSMRYTYLNENKLLLKYWSGFRPMHSTLTVLTDTTDNYWYFNIDNGLTKCRSVKDI